MANKENLDLDFVGHITDSVHGHIPITASEKKLINSDIFRRLQDIKQLSVVNWTFPGSEHTRYAHSLGVMHVADKIFMQLAKNKELNLTNKERKMVRFAGLLHDIGHYPLSHLCEKPFKNKIESLDPGTHINKHKDNFYDDLHLLLKTEEKRKKDVKKGFMHKSTGEHHEVIGSKIILNNQFIKDIITPECGENSIRTITNMIIGHVENNTESNDSLFVQLLHSELDADGIDYLMRDSFYSGTKFGSFELEQLIEAMETGEYKNHKILCINSKGITSADQYLINKFLSYKQVIYNKHVAINEWIIEQVIIWLKEKHKTFPKTDQLNEWIEGKEINDEYLKFNDHNLWTTIETIFKEHQEDSPEYILRYCKAIALHREAEYVINSEHEIISSNFDEYVNKIEKAYQNILGGGRIPILLSKAITKEIKEEDFNKQLDLLQNKKNKDEDIDKDFERAKRLMEGICVQDNNGLRLLCDDERSLMNTLNNTMYVVCRVYDTNKIIKDI